MTEKQRRAVAFIEHELGIKYNGTPSGHELWKFINVNLGKARTHQAERIAKQA